MKKFQRFTDLQRAMTIAGLAPVLLTNCGIRAIPESTAHTTIPPRVAVPATQTAARAIRVPDLMAPRPAPVAPDALVSSVNYLTRSFNGVVGVAVVSLDDGWVVAHNGDMKLPQQSVSKLWVAMTVLDARDQGKLTLDDVVTIAPEDLTLFHQPIASLVKSGSYTTTVRELLTRAMTQSDNTANDKLLHYVGGPEVVRAFIAKNSLGSIRFGPGERLLQSGTAGLQWKQEYSKGNSFEAARAKLASSVRLAAFDSYISDPPDGAAPLAIASALARLKKGELLSPDSTAWLLATMESSHTGAQRLRGAVPADWRFGHKTGTGQNFMGRTAGYNDVGLLTAPDGKTYAVAVMIGDTARPIPERQELMQAVVASVVANHR